MSTHGLCYGDVVQGITVVSPVPFLASPTLAISDTINISLVLFCSLCSLSFRHGRCHQIPQGQIRHGGMISITVTECIT